MHLQRLGSCREVPAWAAARRARVAVCSALFVLAGVGRAQAQAGAPAPAPAQATPPEKRAAPDSTADQLEQLVRRVEEQERENARQRSELQAYKDRLEQTEQATAISASSLDSAHEAALLAEGGAQPFEPAFRLYGFADVGLQRIWGGFFQTGLSQSDATNFVLGNVNIYFDATPLEHLRMLTEVRFTTLPDGAESSDLTSGKMTLQNTAVFDQTSAAGGVFTIHWGAIVLERAQLELSLTDWFNLRVGYFLTPYGIWNVDHGSPTRIMLRPPLLVSIQIMPERQTGIEAYGVFHALPWHLSYEVYVSNGRTIGTVDYSDDKALGLRWVAKTRRPFGMQYGVSGFYGTTQNYDKMPGADAMGRAVLLRKETIAYHELTGGVDVSLDIDALRVRMELFARRIVYEQGKRETTIAVPNASQVQSAGYVMFAYRLPWLGLEPLLVAEFLRQPTVLFGEVVITGSAGLNVYFNSALTLRLQYCYTQVVDFEDTSRDHSDYYLHILASRLILAY